MARKKRQYLQLEEQEQQQNQTMSFLPVWETAIYARLSVENSHKKDDGDSIEGQVEICREYIAEHPYLHLADTYVDNGWTGVNTDRPEFQRLLNDIRDGKIKALVLKDFSRFSRNYIEAGNLLENIFPALGVRFISVVDRYDSFETDGSASSLMIPLKNLINSFYSKDQSKKVSLAIHAKQLAGEHLPSKIPYGYRKSETEAYRLEPDPEAAPIVKRVYAAFLSGESIRSIYHALNEEGIPCPGKLKYLRGEMKRKCYADSQWSQQTVKWLLINPINMGDLVFGRTCKALYLGQAESRRVREEEQWRILPDMHEALVSREDFYRAQALLAESRKAYDEKSASTADYRSKHPQIFKNGMVRCGVCGGNMSFTRKTKVPNGMYVCRKKEYGRCTEWVDITEDNLAPVVWNAVQDQLALYADFDAVTRRLKDTGIQVQRQSDIQTEMQRIADMLGDFQRKREQLYVDYSDGILTAGDYMELKSRFDTQYQEQSAKLNQLSVELAHLSRTLSSENKWLQNAKNIRKARKLTPQVAEAMIDHVNIFKTGRGKRRIEIFFRFQEDKDALEVAIKELEGGE